ncbi:DUF6456 domain-containing protein [Tropicimonas sp. S265A]|uniref:DUF6456 domain-containing protein n=1 Tax=Tropicimonas sp. S265A TaxID=3415134 RepID=UPI003C7E25EF
MSNPVTPFSLCDNPRNFPDWVPDAARHYVVHTRDGLSIRGVAKEAGCAASTILRQIRKLENRRDDVLLDEALEALTVPVSETDTQDVIDMSAHPRSLQKTQTDLIEREARRILRRLCESGAMLAVSPQMEKAVVLRNVDDVPRRIAVVDRAIAQAFVLKEWIRCFKDGKIAQYEITHTGRAALKRLLAEDAGRKTGATSDEVAGFAEQHREWGHREVAEDGPGETARRRVRYNLAESPLSQLARRRDKDGQRFLSDEMVRAGERLREDFELAQMGPKVTQNWEKFLTAGAHTGLQSDGVGGGSSSARDRVHAALEVLGAGLGDVALRCCCFLEGLETAEKRMGWSARSGKIVLRIALERLAQHYKQVHALGGGRIG